MKIPIRKGGTILHFGMPKTGSTSIQRYLSRHLADPRIHYVNLGRPNASSALATAVRAGPQPFHLRKGVLPDRFERARQEARDLLQSGLLRVGSKTALLSGEAMAGLEESEFRDLCELVRMHCEGITAVGYVRRPKELMESAFQQRIKVGLKVRRAMPPPRYRRRLEKFDAVLGEENVRVWLFNPASFPGNCVVQDFCSRLGVALRPEDVIVANEGLSVPALSLLFAYRKFGPGYGVGPEALWENKLLIERIRNLVGPKLRLHSTLAAPFLKKYRADIEWMESRLGVSLAEDIAAHDDEAALRSEDDLLKFAPESLRWLAGELGEEYLKRWHPRMTPQEVAQWMHLLRLKLTSGDQKRPKGMPAKQRIEWDL